jgi:membrane protease YdiL (CAAX protease family)
MAITAPPHPTQAPAPTDAALPQYSRRKIAAVWAAAALPMGALSWIVAPWLSHHISGPSPLSKALLLSITAGLAWQFVMVLILLRPERRSPDWQGYRNALWLRSPRSPKTGRRGGRLWLLVPVFAVLSGIEEFVPQVHHAAAREFSTLLESDAGQALFQGSWGWFALVVAMAVFNTVLGEELLFRGVLLPRMNAAFGKRDWLANGLLFAAYHLHVPWIIPATLVDTFAVVYPAKRFRSALLSIAIHSVQSVFVIIGVLVLVVG